MYHEHHIENPLDTPAILKLKVRNIFPTICNNNLNKRPFALEESKIDVKSVDLKQRHCSTSFSASSKAFSLHLIYFSYYEINHVVCRWGAYFKVMKHTKKVDKYSRVKLERRYCYRYRLQKTEFLSS